jgi:hypothetical protein
MKKILFLIGFISLIFLIGIVSAECLENWVCESWSECNLDGIKERTCEEVNYCNTTEEKPSLEKSCGEDCTRERICEEWKECVNDKRTRICYDTNTCGAAEQRVVDWEYCPKKEVIELTDKGEEVEEEKDEEESEEETKVDLDGCNGCILEDECIKHGKRLEYTNKSVYCDPFDSKVKSQKLRNLQGTLVSCSEDYECISNVCSKSKCVDLEEIKEELVTESNGFSKFLCRLSSFFTRKNYDRCLYYKLNQRVN